MNMQDLIAYRQQCLENKKYVAIKPGNATHEIINVKTAQEIIEKDNTINAVSLLEKYIEKTIECMALKDYNCDVIEISMYFECYVTEGTVHYINETFRQATTLSERISMNRFHVLDDYVRFAFDFSYSAANKDYDDVSRAFDKYNPAYFLGMEIETDNTIVGTVINYDQFVQKIKELGYSISIPDFKTLKEKAKLGEYLVPTITLDFRTNNKQPNR